MTTDEQCHWTDVHQTTKANAVSWYQAEPRLSLDLIKKAMPDRAAAILDVGGGASVLVDRLLDAGYGDISVLDIAAPALSQAKARLGDRAVLVDWYVADVTKFAPTRQYDLWHDRAVFHFLTEATAQQRYVARLKAALRPGGALLIATFTVGGPEKCSGLDIVQYDTARMLTVLGPDFQLCEEHSENHETPWGSVQKFSYFLFRYQP